MPFVYKDYISNSNRLKIGKQEKQLENHLKEVFPDVITNDIQHNQVVQQLNHTINSLSGDGSQEDRSEKKKIAEKVRAKVYMKAFAELKASGDDQEKFAYYYQLLKEMEVLKFHEVGASLTETQDIVNFRENAGTFRVFEEVGREKNVEEFQRKKEQYERAAKVVISKENTAQAILNTKTAPGFLDQVAEYWYEDKDINTILGAQLGKDKASLKGEVFQMGVQAVGATNTRFGVVDADKNRALFKDALKYRMAEMNYPGKLVIPVNVGDNHWVGVSLEFDKDRKATSAVLMDSLKKGEEHKNTINGILEEANILESQGQVKLRNTVVTQQKNDYDCGPWTIHNLVENAKGKEPTEGVNTGYGKQLRDNYKELVRDNGLSPAQQDTGISVSRPGKGVSQQPDLLSKERPQSGVASSVTYGSKEYQSLRIELAKKMLENFPLKGDLKDKVVQNEQVLKMVEKALQKANGGKVFEQNEEIDLQKLNKLEERISNQADDLLAQIGYESKSEYVSYADDMREELNQEDNIKRAQKLNKKDFTNHFVDALKSFEELDEIAKKKEESMLSRLKYGMIDGMSAAKPRNWSPSTKIYAAAVAAILIPPPAGLLVACYFAGKGCLESETGKSVINTGKAIGKAVGKVASGLVTVGLAPITAAVAGVGKLAGKDWEVKKFVTKPYEIMTNAPKNLKEGIMGKPVGKIDTTIKKGSLSEVMREAVKLESAHVNQATLEKQQSKVKIQQPKLEPKPVKVEQDLSKAQKSKVIEGLNLAELSKSFKGVSSAQDVVSVSREQSQQDKVTDKHKHRQRSNSIS